jgi:hypothetical protein
VASLTGNISPIIVAKIVIDSKIATPGTTMIKFIFFYQLQFGGTCINEHSTGNVDVGFDFVQSVFVSFVKRCIHLNCHF